jgi:hypothetical protein
MTLRVAEVHSALVDLLGSIDGVKASLGYWPTAISPPTIFTPAPRLTPVVQAGQLRIDVLRFDVRLCILWQQSAEAERQLIEAYGWIPAKLAEVPGLGLGGMAQVDGEIQPNFITISKTIYRVLLVPVRFKHSGTVITI